MLLGGAAFSAHQQLGKGAEQQQLEACVRWALLLCARRNICILGIKAVDGTLGGGDLHAGSGAGGSGAGSNNSSHHAPVPAPLWRSTSGNRRSASGTLPEGPGTLLSLCVKVVAEHLDDLVKLQPKLVDALPRDLVQQVRAALALSSAHKRAPRGTRFPRSLSCTCKLARERVAVRWVAGV